ncbi:MULTISPECIES: histidine phosphatase family protein [Anaerostipes]|uniref:Histidine phosphatase family protein n=2 Tax=Anaerostipes TaxID=207244 RepID=A0ABV4DHY3_9FIRM|nr:MULTISPECIES: histidine phosphatase family protein [Anaerostipes]
MSQGIWDVKTRMQKALRNIAKDTEKKGGGNVLVVSHGMAIITMLSDMTEQKVPGHLENSSVTKIIYKDGRFNVQSIGDTTYLEQ